MYLQQYDFIIEHRQGKKLSNVARLSHQKSILRSQEQGYGVIEDTILPPLFDKSDESNSQEMEPDQ